MKKILFPTDFSEAAQTALNFAVLLAKTAEAEMVLLHVIQPQVATVAEGGFVADMNVLMLEEGKKSLDKLKGEVEERGVLVKDYVLQGFIQDEIKSVSEQESVDLIIMGSKGAGNFLDKLVGSTAAYVMEKTDHLSIIVPQDYDVKVVERIAFAHQLESPDINYIQKAFDFAETLGVDSLDIVHVYDANSTDLFDNKTVVNAIEEVFSNKRIRFHYVEADSVAEGLQRFIEENDVNILATASSKKTFWDKIFGTHFSKTIALQSKVPLLVIK